MDCPFLILALALFFSFSPPIVSSQQDLPSPLGVLPPPPPGSTPQPFTGLTSPLTPPPPWPFTLPQLSPPLALSLQSPPPTLPPQHPPPLLSLPPPSSAPSYSPPSLTPPRKHLRSPPPEAGNQNLDEASKSFRSPPKNHELNAGQIIGLMFIGVASIMQVCVVAFLLISRRQLFKA